MLARIAFAVAPFLALAVLALAFSGCAGPASIPVDLAICALHPQDCN